MLKNASDFGRGLEILWKKNNVTNKPRTHYSTGSVSSLRADITPAAYRTVQTCCLCLVTAFARSKLGSQLLLLASCTWNAVS